MSRASAAPTFKVLVVEDDDFQADAMKEMLLSIARSTSAQHEALGEYFHMTIAVSRTGEAAWDLLRAAHYDLAIVDIMLPGVSGLDLSWCFQQSLNKPHETELRMAPPDTDSASDAASSEAGPARPPTVLVACTSDPERVRSQLYEHGIHDLLSKPVAMADLRHILHKWMPRHKQIGTSRGAGAAAGEGTRLLNTAGLQRKTSGMFGCRILLVEDDEITRAATECLFQELGLWVDTAADGETAMRILERKDFDMLLLDINLPGISGYALASWYVERQKAADKPLASVVALTAEADEATAREFGVDRCLPKPLTSAAVVGALTAWFNDACLSPPQPRPRGPPMSDADFWRLGAGEPEADEAEAERLSSGGAGGA